MTFADRLNRWNSWYDGSPEEWRSQILLWPLVLVGFINMQLTIAGGFPFGLLLLLALIGIAVVRVPYRYGWIKPAENGADKGARIEVGRVDWLHDLNRSYDSLSAMQRVWIVAGILIVVGAINMKLTLARGYSFGSLFLLALLVLIALRAPYVYGLLTPPPEDRKARLVPHWLARINGRYDEMPQRRRFWTLMAAIVVIAAINLDLTLMYGTPFGLLFLIAFLLIVAARAPYMAGWTGTDAPSRLLEQPRPQPTPQAGTVLQPHRQHDRITVDGGHIDAAAD